MNSSLLLDECDMRVPENGWMSVMPDEVLATVFDFLPPSSLGKVARVCSRFHALVADLPASRFGSAYVLAEKGDVQAQIVAGICLEFGVGAQPDPATGLRYYENAAEKDSINGKYLLGRRLLWGMNCEMNVKRGLRLLFAAAEHVHPGAIYCIARAFFKGQGVPMDEHKALMLYVRSARAGFSQAQYRLAMMTRGDGPLRFTFGRDSTSWLQQAAMAGHGKAQREFLRFETQDFVRHWRRVLPRPQKIRTTAQAALEWAKQPQWN